MFEGFNASKVQTTGATINVVSGGRGSPVLLLHGNPQTHVMWHRIAPQLAKEFTVVVADLRGYGDSSKPPDGENHSNYSKRSMALDQIEVMHHFGFEKFAVVGHDRGGRVGHRLALDHSDRITKLAVLDIVPTHTLLHNVNTEIATAFYHWFFLVQPSPFPETLIADNVEFYLRYMMFRDMSSGKIPSWMGEEAFAEYLRCFSDPRAIHANCEDYRAGASIDIKHDEEDLNRKIICPLLVLWGERGGVHRLFDVLAVWRERAAQVSGKPLPGRHFLPEEIPDETLTELLAFLKP
jgi:haloacetate dehalogenase